MPSQPLFVRFSNDLEFVAASTALVSQAARQAAQERGIFVIALSGGSTPRPVYSRLAGDPDFPFDRTLFVFGDERAVPPDDARSNFRMAAEALFVPANVRPENILRIRGELGAEAAASDYERRLRERFGSEKDCLLFDLALQGVGPDGHTASLFPGRPELDVRDRLVTAAPAPDLEPRVDRVSLTLDTLNRSRDALFLAATKGKEDILKAVREDIDAAAARYPAAMLRPADRLVWHVLRV